METAGKVPKNSGLKSDPMPPIIWSEAGPNPMYYKFGSLDVSTINLYQLKNEKGQERLFLSIICERINLLGFKTKPA